MDNPGDAYEGRITPGRLNEDAGGDSAGRYAGSKARYGHLTPSTGLSCAVVRGRAVGAPAVGGTPLPRGPSPVSVDAVFPAATVCPTGAIFITIARRV